MPQPLDIALGLELSPERTSAIEAVRAYCSDENSVEFWDRVKRVEDICQRWDLSPALASRAADIVSPYLSPDGERGHEAVFDADINALMAALGRAFKGDDSVQS